MSLVSTDLPLSSGRFAGRGGERQVTKANLAQRRRMSRDRTESESEKGKPGDDS